MSEQVNHPSHYNQGKIEVIEFLEDKNLNFHRANAVKYIARAGLKDPSKEIQDLEKAIWYLQRNISILKGENVRPNDMNTVGSYCVLVGDKFVCVQDYVDFRVGDIYTCKGIRGDQYDFTGSGGDEMWLSLESITKYLKAL